MYQKKDIFFSFWGCTQVLLNKKEMILICASWLDHLFGYLFGVRKKKMSVVSNASKTENKKNEVLVLFIIIPVMGGVVKNVT